MKSQIIKKLVLIGSLCVITLAAWFVVTAFDEGCACKQAEVEVLPAVHEYFQVRKQAFLTGDVTVLHQRYSSLAAGENLQTGVNLEAFQIEHHHPRNPVDVTYDLEHYDPIQVKINNNTAEVVIHGQENYLLPDAQTSGGEFHLTLTLRQQNGDWTVTQTDEKTLEEYHTQH